MKAFLKTTKKNLRELRSRRFFWITAILSLLLLAASPALIWWQLFPEAGAQIAVPLHYNMHFGVDRFGPPWQLFSIPFVGLLVWLVSGISTLLLWSRDHVLSYVFSSSATVIEFILLIGTTFVVLLNLSYSV